MFFFLIFFDRFLVLRRSQESDPDSFSEFMLVMSI